MCAHSVQYVVKLDPLLFLGSRPREDSLFPLKQTMRGLLGFKKYLGRTLACVAVVTRAGAGEKKFGARKKIVNLIGRIWEGETEPRPRFTASENQKTRCRCCRIFYYDGINQAKL